MADAGQASSGTTWWRTASKIALLLLVGLSIAAATLYAFVWWGDEDTAALGVAAMRPPQPVNVATALPAPIQAWIFAEGTARAVQREYLTFELSGRVTFVEPEKAGVPVEEGEVLARLDKRRYAADVDAALATLEEAKSQAIAAAADRSKSESQLEVARRELERMRQLVQKNAISQAEFEQAQADFANAQAAVQAAEAHVQAVQATIAAAEARLRQAEVALEEAEIVSPIDGIVAYLNIEEGRYFTPEIVQTADEAAALATVPIVVIDPSEYEITVDVPAYQAGRVQVGQPVVILPGGSTQVALVAATAEEVVEADIDTWAARGVVYAVNPAVNPGGRSIEVEIRSTEGAEFLRDGMFVACWIATEQEEDAVVAPFDAFLYEENRPYVFVVDPGTQQVERRNVELGIQGLRAREIRAGVAAGEQLVTEGRYRLVEGAPVAVLDAERMVSRPSPIEIVD